MSDKDALQRMRAQMEETRKASRKNSSREQKELLENLIASILPGFSYFLAICEPQENKYFDYEISANGEMIYMVIENLIRVCIEAGVSKEQMLARVTRACQLRE